MLGNGAPVWPRSESTEGNRAVTDGDGQIAPSEVTQPLLNGPRRGQRGSWSFQTGGLEGR